MENTQIIELLSKFVTEQRLNTFKKVIENRTNYVTVVLEDIFQSHNASAVLRTCDCFGIQNVNVIENRNEFKPNPEISLGASNWLTINSGDNKAANTKETLLKLKKEGYRIIATTPHHNAIPLKEFDINKGKFALLFGTELTGLTDEALSLSDEFVKIQMYGFTESFNISVSAAIFLSNLIERLKNTEINWQITDSEKEKILADWLKCSVKSSDLIINAAKKS